MQSARLVLLQSSLGCSEALGKSCVCRVCSAFQHSTFHLREKFFIRADGNINFINTSQEATMHFQLKQLHFLASAAL